MSDKRWTVDDEAMVPALDPFASEELDAAYDRLVTSARSGCCDNRRKPCTEHSMWADGAEMALMAPEVITASNTAARVRALAARLDNPRNWNTRYTGAEVASMLREAGDHDA